MDEGSNEMRTVALGTLGERLSALRVREPSSLGAVRRSLAQHGQLTLFSSGGQLEIIDGFKRVVAARALGLPTLFARIEAVSTVEAKLRVGVLSERSGLTELEEGWLVRSLYREDGLSLPEIACKMCRHKSWVWRRLMLVEALDVSVQSDVRLGLIAPRAAVAVSRLPRGNQPSASAVVMRRGLTVRQTELLVEQALAQSDGLARAALLTRWLDGAVERILAVRAAPRTLDEYVAEEHTRRVEHSLGHARTQPRDLSEYDRLPLARAKAPSLEQAEDACHENQQAHDKRSDEATTTSRDAYETTSNSSD